MAGEAYPDVPLYCHDWTALTGTAMRAQLAPFAGRGPEPAKAGNASLEGRSPRVVTGNGLSLAHRYYRNYRKEQGQWMLSSAELA